MTAFTPDTCWKNISATLIPRGFKTRALMRSDNDKPWWPDCSMALTALSISENSVLTSTLPRSHISDRTAAYIKSHNITNRQTEGLSLSWPRNLSSVDCQQDQGQRPQFTRTVKFWAESSIYLINRTPQWAVEFGNLDCGIGKTCCRKLWSLINDNNYATYTNQHKPK